ncbi:hypothetical protein [Anabaena azotica]|uniref:hypothetical protein n=1 Tax=Anabaena azotica TaxID=197653 RepID=UPI001F5554A8|nr:hypothetical protein [Anabaena azotica]
MSNTGKGRKLASFNCDQKMWQQFIARCQSQGTTATATLTRFIQMYLDGSLDNLDAVADHDLDNNGLDTRIRAIAKIENYFNSQPKKRNSFCQRNTLPLIIQKFT